MRIRPEQTPICCKVGDRVSLAAVIENKPRKAKVDWYKMKGIEETSLSKTFDTDNFTDQFSSTVRISDKKVTNRNEK